MGDSRLSGMRTGFENAAKLEQITRGVKNDIPQGREIYSVEGRGEVLRALYAERRVDAMSDTIRKVTGGFVTNQELQDAVYLLNVASKGY